MLRRVCVCPMQWKILIEPNKQPITNADILFSKGLESIRKDVECFFGILKARFRILKLALAYQNQKSIDNVFFTCCILHNMLHTYDGMDGLEEDVDWVGSAELQETWENNKDTTSVGTKDDNHRVQTEPEHDVRRGQLMTSFMYRKKYKKDITWLAR